jgi:hypothetical protein
MGKRDRLCKDGFLLFLLIGRTPVWRALSNQPRIHLRQRSSRAARRVTLGCESPFLAPALALLHRAPPTAADAPALAHDSRRSERQPRAVCEALALDPIAGDAPGLDRGRGRAQGRIGNRRRQTMPTGIL